FRESEGFTPGGTTEARWPASSREPAVRPASPRYHSRRGQLFAGLIGCAVSSLQKSGRVQRVHAPKAAKGTEVVAGDNGAAQRKATNELTVGKIRQMEEAELRSQFAEISRVVVEQHPGARAQGDRVRTIVDRNAVAKLDVICLRGIDRPSIYAH